MMLYYQLNYKTSLTASTKISLQLGQTASMRRGPSGIAFINFAKSLPEINKSVVESTFYSLEEIAKHNTPDDAWSIYNGWVFDLTKYLKFHPGGVETILPFLGKDMTEAATKAHSWVNIFKTIEKLCIGRVQQGKEPEKGPRTFNAFGPVSDDE